MKCIAVLAAGSVISAGGLGLLGAAPAYTSATAPAYAMSTAQVTADQTINELKWLGYNVVVHKGGTKPLNESVVTSVRPGQTFSRTDSGVPGNQLGVGTINQATTLIAKTVYVTVGG